MTHPNESERQKAGLFQAGKVALWVWVILALVPVAVMIGCCGLCGLGSIVDAGQP